MCARCCCGADDPTRVVQMAARSQSQGHLLIQAVRSGSQAVLHITWGGRGRSESPYFVHGASIPRRVRYNTVCASMGASATFIARLQAHSKATVSVVAWNCDRTSRLWQESQATCVRHDLKAQIDFVYYGHEPFCSTSKVKLRPVRPNGYS